MKKTNIHYIEIETIFPEKISMSIFRGILKLFLPVEATLLVRKTLTG